MILLCHRDGLSGIQPTPPHPTPPNHNPKQGLEVGVITIGNKGTSWLKSRAKLIRTFEMGQSPSPATAAAIAEELLSEYLSGEVRQCSVRTSVCHVYD